MTHAYFGELAPGTDYYAWEGKAPLGDRMIDVHLVRADELDARGLDRLAVFPKELARFDAVARAAIAEDEDSVGLYVEHHLDELAAEVLEEIFGVAKGSIDRDLFLSRVVLRDVRLYPASETAATFDYGLPEDETNYVLAVGFDASGNVRTVEMES